MAITELDKSRWKDYFDRVSKTLRTKLVELDIESLKLGDQLEVEWAPLVGLTYDPKDDVMAVLVEGVESRGGRGWLSTTSSIRSKYSWNRMSTRSITSMSWIPRRTPYPDPEGSTQVAHSVRVDRLSLREARTPSKVAPLQ